MERPSLRQAVRHDLRLVPGVLTALFCVSIVIMNLLANKIIFETEWIAADGGFLVSWIAFLCMDIATKAFGPRVANTLSFFALLTNLFVSLVFYAVSIIPTEIDYTAFNTTVGGTWFILLNSSIAFITSAIINNYTNEFIGRLFRRNPDGKAAYITRSYISTFIGQCWDNLVFSILTYMVFAPLHWGPEYGLSLFQCMNIAIVGALLEMLMEVVFSPVGYTVLKHWRQEGLCAKGKEDMTVL